MLMLVARGAGGFLGNCGVQGTSHWYKVRRHWHLKRFPAAKRNPERQMFELLRVPAGAYVRVFVRAHACGGVGGRT